LLISGRRIGPEQPLINILEFGDYQCPACGFFEKSVRAFRAQHPSEVALVFRNWPLPYHPFAYPAARAAECAGNQGRFTEFHDWLYSHQDSLGSISFDSLAQRLGVNDLALFHACNAAQSVSRIDADSAVAHILGSSGTPTVVINGRRWLVAPTLDRLEALLKTARKHGESYR
jgi:protein-disulfide isomerase